MPTSETIAQLAVRLVMEDQDFQRKLTAAQTSTTKFSGGIKKLGNMLGTVLKRAFAAAAASMAAFSAATIVTGARFEYEIRKVAAISKDGSDRIGDLTDKARELGSQTSFSATQAAEAMLNFSRAGMSTVDILSATRPALLLAEATASDMTLATESMAAALKVFNLTGDQGTRVADVFSATLRNSLFNLQGLTDGMKYAGVAGSAFGISLEETAAALATFRNQGLEASQAGVYFRAMLAKAANVTPKASAALSELGLTARDINPELHDFSTIMQTLGDSGISASQGMRIFGQRAGASVANIAQQFQAGATDFHDITDSISESAGETERIWEEMTDTVQYQSIVAKSAFQELMLTVFDVWGGQLKELFMALTDVINFTSMYIQMQTTQMKKDFDGSLGSVIDMLKNNKEEIAVGFVKLLTVMADVFAWTIKIIPHLDNIFRILFSIFVGLKVTGFVTAIYTAVIPALAAAGTAAAFWATAVNIATFGAAALAGGVIAFGVAMSVTSGMVNEAGGEVESLRSTMAALARETEKREFHNEDEWNTLISDTKTHTQEVRAQLIEQGNLNRALDRELQILLQLNPAEAERMRLNGQLFESEGRLITVRQALISGDEAQLAALEANRTAMVENIAGLEAERQMMNYRLADMRSIHGARVEEGDVTANMLQLFKLEYNSVEEVNAAHKALRDSIVAEGQAYLNLEQQIEAVNQSIAEQQAARKKLAGERASADAARAWAKLQKDRISAAEKRAKIEAALEERGTLAGATALETFKHQLNERTAAITTQIQEEMNLYHGRRGSQEKLLELEVEFYRLADLERSTSRQEILAEMDSQEAEFSRNRKGDIQDEKNAILTRYTEELDAIDELHAKAQATIDAQSDMNVDHFAESMALAKETSAHREEAATTVAIQLSRLDRDQHALAQSEIAGLTEGRLDQTKALEQEYRDFVYSLQVNGYQLSQEEQQRIADEFLKRRQARELQIADNVRAITGEELSWREQAQREYSDWDKENSDATEEQKETARKALMKKFLSEELRERLAKLKKYAGAAIAVFKTIAKAGAAVFKGLASASQAVFGLFQSISGFSFNLVGMIGDLTSAAQEAGGAFNITEQAQTMVDDMVGGAITMMEMFVAGAPILIARLAESIPELMRKFAAALPQIVRALANGVPNVLRAIASNIGIVIDALASSIPILMRGVGEAIPIVVTAIVEAVPQIISAILEALPAVLSTIQDAIGPLIEAIVGAVVQIVAAIPEIITMLLASLPAIIVTLMDGVTEIIRSVIEALPLIILAIVESFPYIIRALMEGLVGLVVMLVEMIPVLIAEIISLIPEIVLALIMSISEIMTALVLAVPDLIIALVQAIPVIMVALVAAIPEIVMALVFGIVGSIGQIISALVVGVIGRIPEILAEVWLGLMDLLYNAWDNIMVRIREFFDKYLGWITNVFGGGEDGEKGMIGKAWDATVDGLKSAGEKMAGWFSYSGIDYVPATMRVTVHPGEAVVPADRNARGGKSGQGDPATPGYGPPSGGGQSQPIDIAIMAEGRLLDAVQVTAMQRGHAPKITRELRRQSGVKVGFNRGKFQSWSKA